MLSRGEESCGEVGLNSGFSGFFMVGEDMSASGENTHMHAHTHKCTLKVRTFVHVQKKVVKSCKKHGSEEFALC